MGGRNHCLSTTRVPITSLENRVSRTLRGTLLIGIQKQYELGENRLPLATPRLGTHHNLGANQ